MPRLRRGLAVLALALALFPLTSLWDWWTGVWAGSGCILEPGGCPAGPGTDAGCGIDPGGRCAPAPSPDEGCGIDPNGATCPDRQ